MDRSLYPHISKCQCGSVGTSKNPVQIIPIWRCLCCSSGKSFERMQNSTLQGTAQTVRPTSDHKIDFSKTSTSKRMTALLTKTKNWKILWEEKKSLVVWKWMGIKDCWCNRKSAWKPGFHYFKTHCSSDKQRRLILCCWWPRLSLWQNRNTLQFFQITSWECQTQGGCFNYFTAV